MCWDDLTCTYVILICYLASNWRIYYSKISLYRFDYHIVCYNNYVLLLLTQWVDLDCVYECIVLLQACTINQNNRLINLLWIVMV